MVFAKQYGAELKFKLLNKAGEALLGLKAKDLLGKSDYDFFPKEQADHFTRTDHEVFKTNAAKVTIEPIDTPTGQRWLRTHKVPTFKSDGSPDLLIGISTDITEEMKMQKAVELERAKSAHAAKLASLGEMSAGMAHEINNPLAILVGNLHLLAKFRDNPEKFESKIKDMERAAARIERIVKGLRKFSRSSGTQPHVFENLDILVSEALILTEANAKRHNIVISTQIQPDLFIKCDGVEIEQVLVNLINNAVDAVKKHDEKWVRIHAFNQDADVVIQVEDSGTGITSEMQSKIFQPFLTTKSVGEGTGLGLAIAKGIIEEHAGKISIKQDSQHTCFEIRLPAVKSAKKEARDAA
jgi:PAS domain S-box-containing protein